MQKQNYNTCCHSTILGLIRSRLAKQTKHVFNTLQATPPQRVTHTTNAQTSSTSTDTNDTGFFSRLTKVFRPPAPIDKLSKAQNQALNERQKEFDAYVKQLQDEAKRVIQEHEAGELPRRDDPAYQPPPPDA